MASGGNLQEGYTEYCSKPNMLTTKDMTTWLTHSGLMKKTGAFSSNSLDICFSKHKTKGKNFLTFDQFKSVLKDAAKDDYDNCCSKMEGCKKADHMKSKTSSTGGVSRMTDSSKYTGAHKERFDESGKGKGAGGREDKADNTGYVGNYKGEGTHSGKK